MDLTQFKLVEISIALALYFVLRVVINKSIDRTLTGRIMVKSRAKIVKKAANLILLTSLFTFILILFGVNQSEVAFFMGSIFTVIGIALFAQWSILSNITSGLILFFYHTVKLDDVITVIDKDYEVEGRVSDIGLFFVILKSKKGEVISIPSNVFIQKMIRKQVKD